MIASFHYMLLACLRHIDIKLFGWDASYLDSYLLACFLTLLITLVPICSSPLLRCLLVSYCVRDRRMDCVHLCGLLPEYESK
jgi:hypothetical protein